MASKYCFVCGAAFGLAWLWIGLDGGWLRIISFWFGTGWDRVGWHGFDGCDAAGSGVASPDWSPQIGLDWLGCLDGLNLGAAWIGWLGWLGCLGSDVARHLHVDIV